MAAAISGIAVVVSRDGARPSAPSIPTGQQLPHHVDVSLKKARFSELKDGMVVWELFADRVDYDKQGDMAFLSGITMVTPATRSRGAVTVTADHGDYAATAKNVRLNGHVRVVTDNGATFETRTIQYNGAAERFSTTDPVSFRQQRLHLTAVGMELGVENQTARFISAVDASIISR